MDPFDPSHRPGEVLEQETVGCHCDLFDAGDAGKFDRPGNNMRLGLQVTEYVSGFAKRFDSHRISIPLTNPKFVRYLRSQYGLMNLKIDLELMPGASAPEYQSAGAAGMDLCSTEAFELKPGERRGVTTGVKISLPQGYEAQVRPRSGLAIKHGISMVNAPGTIDSDYRGEIRVILINLGQEVVPFACGDRVAQLVIAPVTRAEWNLVDQLDPTERGAKGFGSSGGFGSNGV